MQSLYGNISGYIGFFLGYSLFQVPKLLLRFYSMLKKNYFRVIKERRNTIDLEATLIAGSSLSAEKKEEKEERNIEQELKYANRELFLTCQKFQELHERISK